jgi:hypothetical protein
MLTKLSVITIGVFLVGLGLTSQGASAFLFGSNFSHQPSVNNCMGGFCRNIANPPGSAHQVNDCTDSTCLNVASNH